MQIAVQIMDKPLQFGIRHLLGVMFAVALLSALIAPWVRGWSAGQWLKLGTQTGVMAAAFLLFFGSHVWLRRRMLHRLGTAHFQATSRTWGNTLWQPADAYTKLAFATLILFMLTAISMFGGKVESPMFYGICGGILGAIGVAEVLDPPNRMLIGENGVTIGNRRFLAWDQLSCSYQPLGEPAPILLKAPGWAFIVQAPAASEPLLAEFLQSRTRSWENPLPRRTHRTML